MIIKDLLAVAKESGSTFNRLSTLSSTSDVSDCESDTQEGEVIHIGTRTSAVITLIMVH